MRGTDTRYFSRGMIQRMRNLTGHHIDFITIGDRNQHIRIINTGTFKHARIGSLPDFYPHIKMLAQITQGGGISINNGDIIVFMGK